MLHAISVVEMRQAHTVWVEKTKGRDDLENLSVCRRVIIQFLLVTTDRKV
jgi:hypothetical protein